MRPAAVEYSSAEGMPEPCTLALRNLLVACADTKLLLGYHYGEWTFGTPVLEAAIANCSLAQTELGHVRLLHGLLKSHFDVDAEAMVEQRPAAAFASVTFLDRDLPDWAAVVAATYVVDLGVTRLLQSMSASAFLPVRNVVDKMLDEERYHAHHGRGWFRALAARGPDALSAVERASQAALRSLAEWFGPADEADDAVLVAARIKEATNVDLMADVSQEVGRTGSTVGVHLGLEPPEFAGWTAATRRTGGAGPSEEILYHMRGAKNALFRHE